ncbi:MAG: 16S rRNA (cytosine(1402)-N(4))-methyltransferase RsmH [Candidatus Electrothrix sp. AR3]|nr:16S rRNA (cytosine(1402)-N(4))-methyltransferase RsmH [Candidatus Electrothrix sp. AR3]
MNNGREVHIPVLAQEVVEWLRPSAEKCYVDGTLGLGGHTELILKNSAPTGQVFGFDWDVQAIGLAQERLAGFGERLQPIHASYADILPCCHAQGVEQVDGILVDLGVSSLQLDTPERGFSFMADAPLDMRMDRRRPVTAAELLNTLPQEALADIFFHYGEERQARRIARFIMEARLKEPLTTTRQLAELVRQAIPSKYQPKKIHPATKVFQALRIAVNRELDNLAKLLAEGGQLLAPGGRLCIITFHSLEDRMVKRAFLNKQLWQVLTKRPILPTADEIRKNPRARSAKLRVAERA